MLYSFLSIPSIVQTTEFPNLKFQPIFKFYSSDSGLKQRLCQSAVYESVLKLTAFHITILDVFDYLN